MQEQDVIAIIEECRAAGKKAANEEQARQLKARGWDSPYENHPVYGQCARPLDACGYGYPVIDCNQPFYRIASKLSKRNDADRLNGGRNLRFTCDKQYGGRGGAFSVYDMCSFQDMCLNIAAENAVIEVLTKHGVKVLYLHTWVD